MDFDACRFDFRLDSKNGLQPSKRKRGRRSSACYATLFKCKICGSLFDQRSALLEHKLVHNEHRCPLCGVRVSRKATLREHLALVHMLSPDQINSSNIDLDLNDPIMRDVLAARDAVMRDPGSQEVPLCAEPQFEDYAPFKAPKLVEPPPEGAPAGTQPGMMCLNMPLYIGGNPADPSHVPPPVTLGQQTIHQPPLPRPSQSMRRPLFEEKGGADSRSNSSTPSSAVEKLGRSEELEPGEIRRPASLTGPQRFAPSMLQLLTQPRADDVPPLLRLKSEPAEHTASPPYPFTGHAGSAGPMLPLFTEPNQEEAMDLSMKVERNCFSPPEGKGKKKAGLNSMVAKLWQTKIKTDDCGSPSLDLTSDSPQPTPPPDCMDDVMAVPSPPPLTDVVDFSQFSGLPTPWRRSGGKAEHPPPFANPNAVFMLPSLPPSFIPDLQPSPLHMSNSGQHSLVPMRTTMADVRDLAGDSPVNTFKDVSTESPLPTMSPSNGKPQPHRSGSVKFKPYKFHTVKFHTCKTCQQLFDSQEKLWEHQQLNQCEPCGGIQCAVCPFMAESTSAVVEHVLHAHGSLAATEDGDGPARLSPSVESVISNVMISSPVRGVPAAPRMDPASVICGQCGQGFTSHDQLEVHILSHDLDKKEIPKDGVESLKCNYDGCSYTCINRFQLWHHVQEKHFHKSFLGNKQKQIICPEEGCGRRFVAQNHLKRHMVVHSTARPLTCSHAGCSKRFKNMMNLRKHELMHTPQYQTAKCMLCDFDASDYRQLSEHIKFAHWQAVADVATADFTASDASVIPDQNMESEETRKVTHLQFPMQLPLPLDISQLCDQQELSKSPDVAMKSEALLNIMQAMKIPLTDIDSSLNLKEPNPQLLRNRIAFAADSTTPGADTLEPADSLECGVGGVAMSDGSLVTCVECQDVFISAAKLWSHCCVTHTGVTSLDARMHCVQCDFATCEPLDFETHCKAEHGMVDFSLNEYPCRLCGATLHAAAGYAAHALEHGQRGVAGHPCPENRCSAMFDDLHDVFDHVNAIHKAGWEEMSDDELDSGDKARHVTCTYKGCHRTFREAKHLKVHLMMHTDERPLKCALCDYTCRQRNSLNWHMKAKHGMSKDVTLDGRTVYL